LSVPVLGGYTGYFAFRLILGVVGWIIILLLIQTGLKEIRTAQAKQTPDAV
jgi:uncharacterized membrane protein